LLYIGKNARRTAFERKQKSEKIDSAQVAKDKLKNFLFLKAADKVNATSKEIRGYINSSKPIPPRILNELVNVGKEPTYEEFLQGPKKNGIKPSPVEIRETRLIKKEFSRYRWSSNERDILKRLFNEIDKPNINTNGGWRNFYETCAERFQGLSIQPKRGFEEIISQLELMVTNRIMKEDGEIEFWKDKKKEAKKQKKFKSGKDYSSFRSETCRFPDIKF
jgi:hypothetical protein